MDDIYATELLRQTLTDALEREDAVKQALQAARNEMQSLQTHAHEHKQRYQQLDDLLEAEEAKTHAERLARQAAEETTRQHRAEVLKLRRNEATANQHCEAAESEVINLQRELSTERSAAVTAGIHSNRLREDIRQAEANGMAAYDMLDAARASICSLEQDLKLAADRISVLEQQARGFEEIAQKEHQQMTEAENTLSATTTEIKNTELRLSDLSKKYNALEAEHSKCHRTHSVPVTGFNTVSVADATQSPISIHDADPPPSKNAQDQIRSIAKDKDKPEAPITKPTSSTATDQALNPPLLELPALPEPAILRPQLASVTNFQVEVFKASGRIVPVANTKNLRWKFFWRLPGNLLRLLIQDAGQR